MVVPKYPYSVVFKTERHEIEPSYGGGECRLSGCQRLSYRRFPRRRLMAPNARPGTTPIHTVLSLYESPQGKDRANFRLADVQGEG